MAPGQATTIDRILVEQILSNFTVLYQGPKIWNSLPISITSSSTFFTFKKKMLQFLSIKSWIDQAALTQHHIFYLLMTAEVAPLISLVVSWILLAIIVNAIISSFFLVRQINKWWWWWWWNFDRRFPLLFSLLDIAKLFCVPWPRTDICQDQFSL